MNSKILEYAPNFLNNTSSISGDVSTKSFQTVKIGQNAGSLSSGESNVFIGTNNALNSINNSHCVFIGAYTGISAKNGSFNTLLGSVSGINIIDGSHNTVCGFNAGNKITSGSFNTIFGADTANGINNGNYNVVYGVGNASNGVSYAYSNIIVGNHNVSTPISFASNNITIGNSNVFNDHTDNSVVLGNNCMATTKSVVIGNDLKGDTQNNIAIGSNITLINRGIITDPLVGDDEIIRNNAKNRINLEITANPQQNNLIHIPYNTQHPPQRLSTSNTVVSNTYTYTINPRVLDTNKLGDGLHTIQRYIHPPTTPTQSPLTLYDIYVPNFINGPTNFEEPVIDLSKLFLSGFITPFKFSVVETPRFGYITSNVYDHNDTITIVEYPECFLEPDDDLTVSLEIFGTTWNDPKHTISFKRDTYYPPQMIKEIFLEEGNSDINFVQKHYNGEYYNIHTLQNLQFIRVSTGSYIPTSSLSISADDLDLYKLNIIGEIGSFNINNNQVLVYRYPLDNVLGILDEYTITFIGIDRSYTTRTNINLPDNLLIFVEDPPNNGNFNLGYVFSVGDIPNLVFSGHQHSSAHIRFVDKSRNVISKRVLLTIKSYIYRNLSGPIPTTMIEDNYQIIENSPYNISITHKNAPNLYPDLITEYSYYTRNPLRSLVEIQSPKQLDITIYPFSSVDLKDYINVEGDELYIALIDGGLCGYVEGGVYSNLQNNNDQLKISVSNDQYDYVEENIVVFNINIQNTFSVIVNDQYLYSEVGGGVGEEPITISSPDHPLFLNGVNVKDVYVGLGDVGEKEYILSIGQPHHESGFSVNHKVIKDRFIFFRDPRDVSMINEVSYRLLDGQVSGDFTLTHEIMISSPFNNIKIPQDHFEYSIILDNDQVIIINSSTYPFIYGETYTVELSSSGVMILDRSGVVVYHQARNISFQQVVIRYDLEKNLINSPPDLVNYSLVLEISALTLNTSIDDTVSHNLGVGKNIRTSGRNNICIGKDFDTFGNNSIILGNNIGVNLDGSLGGEYDIGVHESIIVGNNCFSGSTAKNIISIGNNIMTDVVINTSSDFTNISSYFQQNPVLIGNGIRYNPEDPAIINIGDCFKEFRNRIEVDKDSKKVVIDKLDISNNTIIKHLLERIEILEQKISDISK